MVKGYAYFIEAEQQRRIRIAAAKELERRRKRTDRMFWVVIILCAVISVGLMAIAYLLKLSQGF